MTPITGPVPVVLDGVTFFTDPIPYDPFNWEKRASKMPQIGLTVTVLDQGVTVRDAEIKLASGNAQFLDTATVKALLNRWLVRRAEYAFTDWIGNAFTVFIKDFHPIPKIRGKMRDGSTDTLYTYTMTLWITGCTQLLGTAYSE